MGEWPHCPNGCGPLTHHHGVWGCPDCEYIPHPTDVFGDGFPEVSDDE